MGIPPALSSHCGDPNMSRLAMVSQKRKAAQPSTSPSWKTMISLGFVQGHMTCGSFEAPLLTKKTLKPLVFLAALSFLEVKRHLQSGPTRGCRVAHCQKMSFCWEKWQTHLHHLPGKKPNRFTDGPQLQRHYRRGR